MPKPTLGRASRTCAAAASLAVLALVGCAGTPPPDDAIAAAELALRRAETSEAPRESPVQLQAARDKLMAAQRAMGEEEYGQARRLAQESAADSGYAEAQANAAVAARNRQSVDEGIEALRVPPAGAASSPVQTVPMPGTTGYGTSPGSTYGGTYGTIR